MSSLITPSKIEAYDSTSFLVTYPGDREYVLPYFQLRFFCPCASCVDEMSGKRILKESSIPKTIKPVSVQLVGRYAVQVNWSDGHSTGLYHFERLFELCQKLGVPSPSEIKRSKDDINT